MESMFSEDTICFLDVAMKVRKSCVLESYISALLKRESLRREERRKKASQRKGY